MQEDSRRPSVQRRKSVVIEKEQVKPENPLELKKHMLQMINMYV